MDLFWLNTISEKIKEKEVEKTKIEQQIKDNSLKLGILSEAIKNIEEERLPRISLSIEEKTNKITFMMLNGNKMLVNRSMIYNH